MQQQHPESQSTPRGKPRPLKAKDEFSSLHKRLKPTKDPLPVPDSAIRSAWTHKPQISGSNRIFSTMQQSSPKSSPPSPPRAHFVYSRKLQQKSKPKSYSCLQHERPVTVRTKQSSRLLIIGERSYLSRDIGLEYSINPNRLWYTYYVKRNKDGKSINSFEMSIDDHVPFKHECMSLDIKLHNAGSMIPPLGKRIEPIERPQRSVSKQEDITVMFLKSDSLADAGRLGTEVAGSVNSRALYINSAPFRVLKWDDVELKPANLPDRPYSLIVSSDKLSITLDALNKSQYNLIFRLGKHASPAKEEEEDDEADAADAAPESSPVENQKSDSEQGRSLFGSLDPTKFYSPQGKSGFAGSKLPVASSSPKPLRGDDASSPSRSVDSIRRLTVDPSTKVSGNSTPTKGVGLFGLAKPLKNNESPASKSANKPVDQSKEQVAEQDAADPKSSPERQRPSEQSQGSPEARSYKSPGRRPRRTAADMKAAAEVEELDVQIEPTEEDFDLLRANGYHPFSYRFHDGRSMTIGIEDIARLNPQIYVNDTIIWFFMKLFMDKLSQQNLELSRQTLLLDTFFYFAMRNSDNPPSWAKKIPLAQKRVIVMPIHEQAHWKVAVIVGLDRAIAQRTQQPIDLDAERVMPIIVILDSLGSSLIHHTVKKVVRVLGNSLKMQQLPVLTSPDYLSMRADVPKQTNLTDCGVYLLHYIEIILGSAELFLQKVASTNGRVLDMGLEFWKPDELWMKRKNYKDQLKNLASLGSSVAATTSSGSTNGSAKTGSGAALEETASQSSSSSSSASSAGNQDKDDEDDDSIEVIGMERITRKKRRVDRSLNSST